MCRTSRFGVPPLLVLVLATSFGCSKADQAAPVASVSMAINRPSVALGGVIELTYRFQVAPEAKIAGDYVVFVHLNREDGTTIWNDDHPLPEGVRTSQWRPGQVVEYMRTRFIPTFSYVGPATFEVGLYRDDERLPLSGPNPADRDSPARAYRVGSVELLPRSERVQVYRLSGWHGPEFAADDASMEWQWTQKVATISFKNPKRDVTLFLEYDALKDLPGGTPQQVSISRGDARLAGFAADVKAPTLLRFPVTAAQLGAGEMTELRLEVDRAFVPALLPGAGNDQRELGIRVFHVHVEPR